MGRSAAGLLAAGVLLLAITALLRLQPAHSATRRGITITSITCSLYIDNAACQQLCQNHGFDGESKCIIDLCHCYPISTPSLGSTSTHAPTSSDSTSTHAPTSSGATSTLSPTSTPAPGSSTADPFTEVEKLRCTSALDTTYCSAQCRSRGGISGECLNGKCHCKRRGS